MRAIVSKNYGPPEVLEVKDVAMPVVDDDGILVRVRAAALNPLDWKMLLGKPALMRLTIGGLFRRKNDRVGVDMAGEVESDGKNVTQFKPGDKVFGSHKGALAEYVCAKPSGISFQQAAAIPVAGFTALQGLRDIAKLQPGQAVLINGASGGVGTFAVQVAKALGAKVTGVCSTRNLDLVRSLGADEVIDYTKENFTELGRRFDVVLDTVGNRSSAEVRRLVVPDGTAMIIGGHTPPDLSSLFS